MSWGAAEHGQFLALQAKVKALIDTGILTITPAGLALLDDTDASAQLTTLGVSTFIKTLLDDVDAAAARATLGVLTMGTVQATTSGTAKTFTFPAGTKRIMVSLVDVSTNGANNLVLQLGDAGGIETSGYLSDASTLSAAAVATAESAAAFLVNTSMGAAVLTSGIITLVLHNPATFTWVMSGVLNRGDAVSTYLASGRKSLSAELTQLEINAGGNTFDSAAGGGINVMYE